MRQVIRNNGTVRVIHRENGKYKVQTIGRSGCWLTDSEYKSLRGATNRYEKLVNIYN